MNAILFSIVRKEPILFKSKWNHTLVSDYEVMAPE